MYKKVLVFGLAYNTTPKLNKLGFLKALYDQDICDVKSILLVKNREEIDIKRKENDNLDAHFYILDEGKFENIENTITVWNKKLTDEVMIASEYFIRRDQTRNKGLALNEGIHLIRMQDFAISLMNLLEVEDYDTCITFGASSYSIIIDKIFRMYGKRITYLEQGFFRKYGIQMSSIGLNYQGEILAEYTCGNFDQYQYTIQEEEVYKKCILEETSYIESKNQDFFKKNDYIFLPLQINIDTQIVLFSDYIKSMEKLIDVTINMVNKYNKMEKKKLSIICKIHPWHVEQDLMDNYKYLKEKFKEKVTFVESTDLNYIIANSEAVVTVNSTVGIQALAHTKKVMVLGKAIYGHKDIVYLPSNPDDYYNTFHNMLEDAGKDKANIVAFLKYLLIKKHQPIEDFKKPKRREIEALISALTINDDTYILHRERIVKLAETDYTLWISNLSKDLNSIYINGVLQKKMAPNSTFEYILEAEQGSIYHVTSEEKISIVTKIKK